MTTERRRDYRRETDRDMGLDRDDLFLLLESYKNTIELSTSVLERQEILNASIERILSELVKICGNQVTITTDIGRLPGEFRALIDSLCSGTAGKCDELQKAIENNRKEAARDHNTHSLRIYGAFGILGALLVALLSLLVKVWPNL